MTQPPLKKCGWCDTQTRNTVNIGKTLASFKLVPACDNHAAMVESEKERLKKEKADRAREKKEGISTWW
jgi:hypothetical protein